MCRNRCLRTDEAGNVLAETTLLIPILFLFVLGAIDFAFAFFDFSLANAAVRVGARIAAVSDPVASGLNTISTGVLGGSVGAGDPMPSFQITCDGAAQSCTCTQGSCPGMGSFSWAAMNKIICGRDNTSSTECNYATECKPTSTFLQNPVYFKGMCDVFPTIKAANVRITYTQTGLGFAGRSGGPVPTITVSLQNFPFSFFFLNDLKGFLPANISPTAMTTGEVLSSSAQ